MYSFSLKEFKIIHLEFKGQQTFSVMSQTANIFGFLGHIVSVPTIQPSQWEGSHKQFAKEQAWLYSNKTLFTKTSSRPELVLGP